MEFTSNGGKMVLETTNLSSDNDALIRRKSTIDTSIDNFINLYNYLGEKYTQIIVSIEFVFLKKEHLN